MTVYVLLYDDHICGTAVSAFSTKEAAEDGLRQLLLDIAERENLGTVRDLVERPSCGVGTRVDEAVELVNEQGRDYVRLLALRLQGPEGWFCPRCGSRLTVVHPYEDTHTTCEFFGAVCDNSHRWEVQLEHQDESMVLTSWDSDDEWGDGCPATGEEQKQ